MSKTAPRVRHLNLYTVELDGLPVAQALAISQADAVRLYVESVQQPVLSARLSSPIEARALAGLPLLQRVPAEVDTKTADPFDDVPAAPVSSVVGAYFSEHGVGIGRPAAGHDDDDDPENDPPACEQSDWAPPPGWGDDGSVAAMAARVEAEKRALEAAEQPGEPADCLGAAPTAVESAGVSSAVDDDGGRELTAEEQATYEAQGADRFERHHGSELKRQAEAAAARRAMGGKPVAMYRDPVSGQSWSGRGLKPRWLLAAIEAGRTQDEFLIDPA